MRASAPAPGPLATALPILRAGGAVLWTAAELALVEARMRRRGGDPAAQEAIFDDEMRRWARGLLRIGGVRVHPHAIPPRPSGARLVVANHRTALDIPVLLSLFGGSVLSRDDIAGWPVLGYAARRAQTIFVDRDSAQSGLKAIRAIREQLQRGRTVSVFPEGTTSAGDALLPFSAGAFAAARGLEVEVVAVGLAYPPGTEYTEASFVDHMKNATSRRRLDVEVCCGAPRPLQGRHTKVAGELAGEVAGLVQEARARANAR
ncbi:MAG: 1-acyl-sn-glycerol-3-phosphate acyltransferase [Myxococcales bacterium]|nr:1-acyl-sn-glycerol-3-phosphate acyltransferase [Myxococcales bacterium]